MLPSGTTAFWHFINRNNKTLAMISEDTLDGGSIGALRVDVQYYVAMFTSCTLNSYPAIVLSLLCYYFLMPASLGDGPAKHYANFCPGRV